MKWLARGTAPEMAAAAEKIMDLYGGTGQQRQLTPACLRGQTKLQLIGFQLVSETPEPVFLSLDPQVPWRTSPRPTD